MSWWASAWSAIVRYVISDGRALTPTDTRNPSNETVTDSTVLSLSAAWACVNLLAGTIGSLPIMVYKQDRSGRSVAYDHPLYRILHDSPNADQTAIDFWEFETLSQELRGNSYARISRNAVGQVSSLTPYWPDGVQPYRKPNGDIAYKVAGIDDLASEDMLHIRGFGGSPLGGLSTLSAGRNAFGLAMAIDRAAGTTFANGARPSGVLSTDKMLDKDKRGLLEDLLGEKFVGATNAGRPMLLDNGLTWTQISLSPEDAQMLESRGFSIEEICRFFGVPPIMVGHGEKTSSWGSGVAEVTQGFVKYTLRRRVKRNEAAMMKQLLTPKDVADGIVIEFSLEGLLRGDSSARSTFYQSALTNGWMTINEVRALENLAPVDGGNTPRMQAQNVPITEVPLLGARKPGAQQ